MTPVSHAGPGLARWVIASLAAGLAALAVSGPLVSSARAAGNASAAAGYIERAQNSDGGFASTRSGSSRPLASLWATVALLAAGKNPDDERVNHGASAATYLAGHLSALRSLGDLGLLALVQAGAGGPPGRYGRPAATVKADLTSDAMHADPGGAALGILGLLAVHDDRAAGTAARRLAADQLSDGGWGRQATSDSAATALVLEALAEAGLARSLSAEIGSGIRYLHAAQVNDGSIATSNRTDASSSGDVAATAFTIQALAALRHPTLRTSTGTSVQQGLASYQQRSSGGLSPFGAYDTGVAPSVIQTAQAYPAFDGVAFPLPYVPPLPAVPRGTRATGPNRASAGSAASGISNVSRSPTRVVGAYQGATARGSRSRGRRPARASGGSEVSGRVVGAAAPPRLTTGRGRAPGRDLSALLLALALAGVVLLGATLELRAPDGPRRSRIAVALGQLYRLVAAARRRRASIPALTVMSGVALICLPTAIGMWSATPRGEALLGAFRPYMQAERLTHLRGDVQVLDSGFRQALAEGPRLQFGGGPGAGRRFAAADPQIAGLSSTWPPIERRFSGLLDEIGANRGNYASLAALPPLGLFPWFLVAPGSVLVLLGVGGLARPRAWRRGRWAAVAVGALLVVVPLGLGLYGAGARGARLMAAFRPIETRPAVVALQNDFSRLVVAQAAVSSELPEHVLRSLPAVAELNARWVGTLGDFTPMLGVMSDQVADYQALETLPSFRSLPWFLVGPGVLVLILGLLGSPRRPPLKWRGIPRLKTLELRSRA